MISFTMLQALRDLSETARVIARHYALWAGHPKGQLLTRHDKQRSVISTYFSKGPSEWGKKKIEGLFSLT